MEVNISRIIIVERTIHEKYSQIITGFNHWMAVEVSLHAGASVFQYLLARSLGLLLEGMFSYKRKIFFATKLCH